MNRILYITAFPPNLQTAGQNYSRNLLNDLAEVSKIDIIIFKYKDHLPQIDSRINILRIYSVSTFSKLCNAIKIPYFHPFFTCRFHINLLNYLKKISSNYDIVYFDFSQIFLYSYFLKHTRKILMVHDVIFQKNERKRDFISFFAQSYIELTENKILKSSDEIYCFSSKDKELLYNKYGVKSKMVSFYIEESISQLDFKSLEITDYFVLFGAWNRPENEKGLLWFFDHVYPFILNTKIKVIGPKLSKNTSEIILKFDNVTYLGFIENPYAEIARSQGLIAPLFEGAGVKVKVVESLALGTPVIGTDVAFEGIDITNLERYVHLVNNAQTFIEFFKTYEKVDIEDKITISRNFFLNYNQNKFIAYL